MKYMRHAGQRHDAAVASVPCTNSPSAGLLLPAAQRRRSVEASTCTETERQRDRERACTVLLAARWLCCYWPHYYCEPVISLPYLDRFGRSVSLNHPIPAAQPRIRNLAV